MTIRLDGGQRDVKRSVVEACDQGIRTVLDELNVDGWLVPSELMQQLHNWSESERPHEADPEHACLSGADGARGRFGPVEPAQRLTYRAQIHRSGTGRHRAPVAALKKREAQPLFQFTQTAARRGRFYTEDGGPRADAAAALNGQGVT